MESPNNKMVKNSPNKKGSVKPPSKKGKGQEKKKDDKPEPELSKSEQEDVAIITETLAVEKSGVDAFKKMTRTQIDLIKTTVAKGATDDELQLFLSVCHGAQLNPFLKQVHFVKRWDTKQGREVGTIQVGIDGFRAIAESGGQYAGSDDAVHRDDSEIKIKDETVKVPGSATVTVYKLIGSERCPFTATARWREYYPGDKQGYMWKKMPYGQLAKCAEGLALRKAFPKLLSGLYVPEEMEQAGDLKPSDEDPQQKAISMINRVGDAKALEGFKSKVSGSKKYNAKQKKDIIAVIEKRILILTPALTEPAEPEVVPNA